MTARLLAKTDRRYSIGPRVQRNRPVIYLAYVTERVSLALMPHDVGEHRAIAAGLPLFLLVHQPALSQLADRSFHCFYLLACFGPIETALIVLSVDPFFALRCIGRCLGRRVDEVF